MPGGLSPVTASNSYVDASTPGAQPIYGGRDGQLLLGYEVPDSYTQQQALDAQTAANLAAGPSAPGQVWMEQPSNADIAKGNVIPRPGMWVTPGRSGLAGILDSVVDMEKTLQPVILAAMSGGALGTEGVLASKIINAGAALQKGDTLGGLSQLAGIAQMTDTATALSVAKAIQNNDLTSLATAALSKTDIGKSIGSTEILPDLNVRGALNLVSAVNGLTSKNPKTVINSLVDLQDRVPDLFDSVTAAVTGNSGLDTLSATGADTLSGGAGNDSITGGAGNDSITGGAGNDSITGGAGNDSVTGGAGNDSVIGGGGLDTVTVTGSNGNDVIDNVLGNLNTTRSLGGTPTVLNNVTVAGSCPAGQVRNPLTGKCEDITDVLSGVNVNNTQDSVTGGTVLDAVTVAGTCPAGQHKDPITGACVNDVSGLDTVTVTGTCPAGQHKDPITGACVDDELDAVTVTSCPVGQHRDPVTGLCVNDVSGLDTVTVTGTCPVGQHRDPLTGKCVPDELDAVTVTSCPAGQHKDPITGACVDDELDTVTVTSCPVGQHRDPVTGLCVKDELDTVTVTSCPVGQHRDPVTGLCVLDEVVDTSCPAGQHRDPVTGKCVPDTVVKPPVVTPPVVTPPVTPTPTGGLPTYTDPTGLAGKILTLGKMGNLMRYDEGLKQLDVPTMQRWADMADMTLPTADVSKAAAALAQYAPDAEKDVIPSFYAHGGAVQHLAGGAQPDVQAMLASYDKADVMDALKNLGNIGSGLEPARSKVFALGQMGSPTQQKQLQQMTVIPQLAALLQSRGMKLADGGQPDDHMHPEYDGNPVFRTGGLSGLGGKYVEGKGDGTSDDITAMLANGEYVFSADVVSALGNGSNKAGAKELDHMVQAIRSRARSAPPDKLPPDAKSPLEYLKSSKGSKHG